jgi:hypothetical protein
MGGALEADAALRIANSQLSGNTVAVTATTGDAGALGAVTLFSGGGAVMTIANSAIAGNNVTATAPHGAATVLGAGLLNDGALRLVNVRVTGNRGTATGLSGFAQGGGIWNGVLFVPPDSPLTLTNSQVTENVLTGSPGVDIAGAGIFSAGFPLTLDHVVVARNAPDQCVGC